MDKEIWKDIEGYEGLYQVSNLGRVRSIKILTPALTKYGYLRLTLSQDGKVKSKSIHRLVAQAFIPNPEKKKEVNHIDGNKHNNCAKNLEWSNRSENMLHAYRTGLLKTIQGETHWLSKLTKEQVIEIRKEYIPYNRTKSIYVLAKKYNVSPHTIWLVVTDKTYAP